MKPPRIRHFKDGNVGITDSHHGIGLLIEPKTSSLFWIVCTILRRLDNGEAVEAYKIEYGKN